MTNLKQKLAELLSPIGAGNNAYELGQLAQQQEKLIEMLVSQLDSLLDTMMVIKHVSQSIVDKNVLDTCEALKIAKQAGYE